MTEEAQDQRAPTQLSIASDDQARRRRQDQVTAQIVSMFDRISARYDLLNHLLSLGIDKRWRRRAIAALEPHLPERGEVRLLDVATGTGDLAIAAQALATTGRSLRVIGIDPSEKMLGVGRAKVAAQGLADAVALRWGDSRALPFSDGEFDAVTCAYGARNFADLEDGLREMRRVLKPGGRLALLEFSTPTRTPFRQLYRWYFRRVLPRVGRLVSGDDAAYTYLPESVAAFPDGAAFCDILARCGYTNVEAEPLTLGITTLYSASA